MNFIVELWYSGKDHQYMVMSIRCDQFEMIVKLLKSLTVKATDEYYFIVKLK